MGQLVAELGMEPEASWLHSPDGQLDPLGTLLLGALTLHSSRSPGEGARCLVSPPPSSVPGRPPPHPCSRLHPPGCSDSAQLFLSHSACWCLPFFFFSNV